MKIKNKDLLMVIGFFVLLFIFGLSVGFFMEESLIFRTWSLTRYLRLLIPLVLSIGSFFGMILIAFGAYEIYLEEKNK